MPVALVSSLRVTGCFLCNVYKVSIGLGSLRPCEICTNIENSVKTIDITLFCRYNVIIGGDKMAKINITMDDALLERADNFADNNYTSRSGLISLALRQYLDSQELTQAIKSMCFSMQVIAEKGEVSKEQYKQLEEFKILVDMLSGQSL